MKRLLNSWEQRVTYRFRTALLLWVIAIVSSGCGLSKTSFSNPNSVGPIDGYWRINEGFSDYPLNIMEVRGSRAFLRIYSTYKSTNVFASCVIRLEYSLNYPSANQVDFQTDFSRASDDPVGCASNSPYGVDPALVAEKFRPEIGGTHEYTTKKYPPGASLVLKSVGNSGKVIYASM